MKAEFTHLENKFQALIAQRSIVGLALAVIQDGEVVHSSGMGVTSVEDYQLPITPDTLFAIGSITKSIAAATIMRLVEQKALDLDRPIVEYLKGFEFEDKANGRMVTLRHLLSHSSGLPAAGRNWGLRGRDALRTFVRDDLRTHQFVAPPGKVHIYSNTAISSVAYVAEQATSTPYDSLVQQLIFDPLDMKRSTFNLAKAMTYATALPHHLEEDGTLRVTHHFSDNDMGHASSFCLCSTLDLAKFASALLTQGKLLNTSAWQEMHTPAISLHTSGANYPGALMNAAYGLGLQLGQYRGCRLIRHGGLNQSFNCFMELFPDRQTGVILQTNYMGDEEAINILFELFDELLKPTALLRPPEPEAIPCMTQDKLVGEYLNPTEGIKTISKQDTRLLLDEQHPLMCIEEGQYFYRSGTLRFPVAFPYDDILIVRGTVYRRLHRKNFEPDFGRWQSYAGVFIDPFTPYPDESAIHVRFDGGQISINNVLQEPLSNSQFVSSEGVYEFVDSNRLRVHAATCYVRS
jgi:CubicO group peptidase (beta-lactamase class C family)